MWLPAWMTQMEQFHHRRNLLRTVLLSPLKSSQHPRRQGRNPHLTGERRTLGWSHSNTARKRQRGFPSSKGLHLEGRTALVWGVTEPVETDGERARGWLFPVRMLEPRGDARFQKVELVFLNIFPTSLAPSLPSVCVACPICISQNQ